MTNPLTSTLNEAKTMALQALRAWCEGDAIEQHLLGGEGLEQQWLDRLAALAKAVRTLGGTGALNEGAPSALGRLVEHGHPASPTKPWMLAQAGMAVLIEAGTNPLQGFNVLEHTDYSPQIHSLLEAMAAHGPLDQWRTEDGGTSLHVLLACKLPQGLVNTVDEPRGRMWRDALIPFANHQGDTPAHLAWRITATQKELDFGVGRMQGMLGLRFQFLPQDPSECMALMATSGSDGIPLAEHVIQSLDLISPTSGPEHRRLFDMASGVVSQRQLECNTPAVQKTRGPPKRL